MKSGKLLDLANLGFFPAIMQPEPLFRVVADELIQHLRIAHSQSPDGFSGVVEVICCDLVDIHLVPPVVQAAAGFYK